MINLYCSLVEFEMVVNDTMVLWAYKEHVSPLTQKNRIQVRSNHVRLNHVKVRLNQGLIV